MILNIVSLEPSMASLELGTCNLDCEGQHVVTGQLEPTIRSQLQGPPGRRGPPGSPGPKGDSGEPFCNCENEGNKQKHKQFCYEIEYNFHAYLSLSYNAYSEIFFSQYFLFISSFLRNKFFFIYKT